MIILKVIGNLGKCLIIIIARDTTNDFIGSRCSEKKIYFVKNFNMSDFTKDICLYFWSYVILFLGVISTGSRIRRMQEVSSPTKKRGYFVGECLQIYA